MIAQSSGDGAPSTAAARTAVDVFLADSQRERRARDMPPCASWAGLAAPSRALMEEALAFMDSAEAGADSPGRAAPAARAIVKDAVAFLGGAAAAREPEEGSSSGSTRPRLSKQGSMEMASCLSRQGTVPGARRDPECKGAQVQLALSGAMSRAPGGGLWGHAPSSSLLWHTVVPAVNGGQPTFPVFASAGQSTAGMALIQAFPGGVHRRLEARERTYLDDAAVIHIFLAKRTKPGRRSGLASALSEEYGVTSKAIRDIWKLR
jgi:hypothetical protein